MNGSNPNSRLPASQYKSVNGLKESLRGEALIARSVQSSQNLKMRQGLSLLQVLTYIRSFSVALYYRNSEMMIIFRIVHSHPLFQRGNKNSSMNYTTKRKLLSLKRQSKNALFTEISSPSTVDLIENPVTRTTKTNRPNPPAALHPLKCGVPSNPISTLKKRRKAKLVSEVQKKKIALKSKILSYKIDKDAWSNKGEPSNWNANKRKIEKKLNPTGNASTSARPPNKKRKKAKII